jgi:molecular chaperone GrpE
MSETKDLEPAAEPASGEPADAERFADEPEIEIVAIGDEEVAAPDAPAAAGGDELAELRERHLRLRADFENFRKRAERERGERVRHGVGEALRELLPVADNLERALAAPGGLEDLRRGVEMIARQVAETLARHGVAPITALGRPFDPQLHEAVAREESAEVAEPTVVGELQRGYLHGNRLLRPALVRVAMPAGGGEPADRDEDEVEGDA